MGSTKIQARHVFHAPSAGWDRIHAWREASGEPTFVWGRESGAHDNRWFGKVREAFSTWISATADSHVITVFHDGMGADALGPLDRTAHKVVFLHHWYPRWERNFEWQLRCTGKVMTGDPQLTMSVRDRFRWIPERFTESMAQPLLAEPEMGTTRPTTPPRRTGIWLHGHRWRRHGNRLRSIVDRWLPEAGELEIIVEGGGPPRWARRKGLIWNTGMPLEFALYRLFTWDSVLLLNDFSLDAPWLLRALSLDCFPLVPDGGSLALSALWQDDSAPAPYAWGEPLAAMDLLGQWRERRPELLESFRRWRDDLLQGHLSGEAFLKEWNERKAQLVEQRPPRLRARKPLAGWYPLGWYERVQRLRTGS